MSHQAFKMGGMTNVLRTVTLRSVTFTGRNQSVSRHFHNVSKTQPEVLKLPVFLWTVQPQLPQSASLHTTQAVWGKKRSSRRGKGSLPPAEEAFTCLACGSPNVEFRQLDGDQARVICNDCQRVYERYEDLSIEEEPLSSITPKELKSFLDEYVVGQDQAKIVFSTGIHNHYKRVKHNTSLLPPEPTHEVLEPQMSFYPKSSRAFEEGTMKSILEQQIQRLTTQGYPRPRSKPRLRPVEEPRPPNGDEVVIDKTNILLIGPTGSGKTMLAKTIVKKLQVPFVICDCTQFTAAGYVGSDVDSIITKLYQNADGDVTKCEQGIVFLDEVDKLAKVKQNHNKDVGGEEVQQGLLKIIEGTKLQISDKRGKQGGESVSVDTTNILFVASGAFTGLERLVQKRLSKNTLGFGHQVEDLVTDVTPSLDLSSGSELDHLQVDECFRLAEDQDLISFGMIPEFVGRLPCVCPFHHLTEDMLIQVLTQPKDALIKQYQKLFSLDNVELEVRPSACQALASNTIKKRTGARGLRSELDKCLSPIMYEIPGTDIRKVIIDDDFVLGKGEAVFGRESDSHQLDCDSDVEVTDLEVRSTNNKVTHKQPKITSLQKLRPCTSGE
ncbi:ATP-dependent Clp protease ATP-binding subunit ClpX-like [Mya arenaria]|uniref:ATP-dependent Clp protease ATP-binding subunit ClpX-like n=1 Tax=Mya arenaria TaxID=6604 RepID=UPI0022E1E5C9|nr:ATP-dependent Clp protease ATP-binding subunit ClpX-like [Mya arenaria]